MHAASLSPVRSPNLASLSIGVSRKFLTSSKRGRASLETEDCGLLLGRRQSSSSAFLADALSSTAVKPFWNCRVT